MENKTLFKIIAGLSLVLFIAMGISSLMATDDSQINSNQFEGLSDAENNYDEDDSETQNDRDFSKKVNKDKKSQVAKFKAKFKKSKALVTQLNRDNQYRPNVPTNSHGFHNNNNNKNALKENSNKATKKTAQKPKKTKQALKKQDCNQFDESQEDAHQACMANNARIEARKKAAIARAKANTAAKAKSATDEQDSTDEDNDKGDNNDKKPEEELEDPFVPFETVEEITPGDGPKDDEDKISAFDDLSSRLNDASDTKDTAKKTKNLTALTSDIISALNAPAKNKLSNKDFFTLINTYYLKSNEKAIISAGFKTLLKLKSKDSFNYAINFLSREKSELSNPEINEYFEEMKIAFGGRSNLSRLSTFITSTPPEDDSTWNRTLPLYLALEIVSDTARSEEKTFEENKLDPKLESFKSILTPLKTLKLLTLNLEKRAKDTPKILTDIENVTKSLTSIIKKIEEEFPTDEPPVTANPDRLTPS